MKTPRSPNKTFRSLDVCVSGLTAAGKTTHSHILAGELGLMKLFLVMIKLTLLAIEVLGEADSLRVR